MTDNHRRLPDSKDVLQRGRCLIVTIILLSLALIFFTFAITIGTMAAREKANCTITVGDNGSSGFNCSSVNETVVEREAGEFLITD